MVEQTGHRPSMQAQTLRTKKTKLIGVILPRIDSASISSMIAGILSVSNVSGYHLLLTDTQNDPAKELESLSIFNEKQRGSGFGGELCGVRWIYLRFWLSGSKKSVGATGNGSKGGPAGVPGGERIRGRRRTSGELIKNN